ncbi:cysteine desulfurase family protein [Salinibacter ruber]|uniref:cysteine desulfurase family protein n=1 Tax=Salinibacter ruber TaxID=146919 RepID=UPI000E592EAA|nr:cysteine desulfurase family protein [Salinibacter ruber]
MSQSNGQEQPIYMDHHATTPTDERVVEAMQPYFTEVFGNPSSNDHTYGAEAGQAVQRARSQIAEAINADPSEIVFTSGATEANNLAIDGVVEHYAEPGAHLITCVTEHKAVLDPCKDLREAGYDVTFLPVDHQGMIDLDDLRDAIRPGTVLISLMAANNEIGVLHPLTEIGQIAKEHEVLFHTDATQALNYIPLDVEAMNIDLMSLSGHKIYGPKGIGALYVSGISPTVRLKEQIRGGGQEKGRRSGTLNVPAIVGFGKAVEIAIEEQAEEVERVRELREELWEQMRAKIDDIKLNGHPEKRLPNNLNIALPGIEAQALVVQTKNRIALSRGSACTTDSVEASHVIRSISNNGDEEFSSFRLGIGRTTSKNSIDPAVDVLATAVRRMKKVKL